MSEHGFYYGKIHRLFDRFIKRVDFNLNPFEERKIRSVEEDDVYKTTSHFVPHSLSVVLCEDFNSDKIPSYKQFSLDDFWDYLYSSRWKDSCTLRVLDGALLQMLLHGMYVMERDHEAVCQKHSAFVKNRRRLRPCLKTSKTKDLPVVNEILLVTIYYYSKEFLEVDSYENKDSRPPSARQSSSLTSISSGQRIIKILDPVPFNQQKVSDVDIILPRMKEPRLSIPKLIKSYESDLDVRASILAGMGYKTLPKITSSLKPSSVTVPAKLKVEYKSLPSEKKKSLQGVLQYPYKYSYLKKKKKRHSVHFPILSHSGLLQEANDDNIPLEKPATLASTYPYMQESESFRSRNYSKLFPFSPELEGKFQQGESDQSDLEKWLFEKCSRPSEEEEMPVSEKIFWKSKQKLHHRLIQLKQEEKKKVKDKSENLTKLLRNRPKISFIQKDAPKQIQSVIKILSRTPSFTEYAKYIEEENLRKKKKMSRASELERRKYDEVSENSVSIIPKLESGSSSSSTSSSSSSKGSKSVKTEPNNILTDSSVQKISSTPTTSHVLTSQKSTEYTEATTEGKILPPIRTSFSPLTYTTTTNGRTESQHHTDSQTSTRRRSSQRSRCKKSLKDDSKCVHDYQKKMRQSKLRKANSEMGVYDSDGTDSEISSESLFDTSKLNISYSFENLAVTRLHPKLAHVMSRYLGVDATLQTWKDYKHRSTTETDISVPVDGRSGDDPAVLLDKHKHVLGKLRSFKFLQNSNHVTTLPTLKEINFRHPTFQEFFCKLQDAMNDFVVRRECVITSDGYRNITSVTFTRPSVFWKC